MRTRKLGKPKLVDLFGEEWHENIHSPDLRVEDVRLLEAASRKNNHLVDVPLVLALTGWQPRKARTPPAVPDQAQIPHPLLHPGVPPTGQAIRARV